MAYVTLDTFRPKIQQHCQGASSMLIRQHVLDSIIDFCKRTECLKKDAATFYLEEDVRDYTLKFSGDRYLAVAISSITIGEGTGAKPLQLTTRNELEHSVSDWMSQEATEPNQYFLSDDINAITVYPRPNKDSDDDVYTSAIVTPRRSQTEVDEFLYEKWEDVIVDMALEKLLMINKASWFNGKLAKQFGMSASRGIRRARKTTISGQGKYPGRVQPVSYNYQGNPMRRTYTWD